MGDRGPFYVDTCPMAKHKHRKHHQFRNVVVGGPRGTTAGGVVIPAWPAYMYMAGIGGVTGAGFPGHTFPDGDHDGDHGAGDSAGSGASPTGGDGGTATGSDASGSQNG